MRGRGSAAIKKKPALKDAKSFTVSVSTLQDVRQRARQFVEEHGRLHTAFLIVGVITVFAVIGALFVASGDSPDELYTDTPVAAVDSPLFITSLSHMVHAGVESGGTITVLNNGDEFIPSLIEAIDGARKTINFSVYIWADGNFSKQVIDALIRARQRNVTVRVLLDGFGAKDIPDWKFNDLKEAGGRVEKFRTPQYGKLTRFHRRNHRRAIVIDGEIGFTGGMAVKDSWLGHAEDPKHWRDMMFKVTGPLARSLQSAFVSGWASSSGEMLAGDDTYRMNLDRPAAGVETFIHLVNSPADDNHSMAHFFIMSILAARKSVYIATPYFIPDAHLQRAIIQKAKEGVDVRLLLPGKNIDYKLARASAQAHYEDLLEAGVRIYEYRPTFLHSKFIVVDGQWSIVGSPNLNSRSRQLDEENAFGILDKSFAGQLSQVFLTDIDHADEIRLEEWQDRNVFLRVVQRLAQALDKQS